MREWRSRTSCSTRACDTSVNLEVQNSTQSPSDGNFAQLTFSLSTCSSFELFSVRLFKSTRPIFDELVVRRLAAGLAEASDAALHATIAVDERAAEV